MVESVNEDAALEEAIAKLREKLSTDEGKREFAAAAREDSDYIKKYEREVRFNPRNFSKTIAG